MLDLILSNFHFLRPQWLWALVPTLAFYVVLQRRLDPKRQWRRVIAPHLLAHLEVDDADRFRVRPFHLTAIAMLLGTLAVAGPTWSREISPFAEDTAPLVIALAKALQHDGVLKGLSGRVVERSYCPVMMTKSTRRFAARPSAVWLSAIGISLPNAVAARSRV